MATSPVPAGSRKIFSMTHVANQSSHYRTKHSNSNGNSNGNGNVNSNSNGDGSRQQHSDQNTDADPHRHKQGEDEKGVDGVEVVQVEELEEEQQLRRKLEEATSYSFLADAATSVAGGVRPFMYEVNASAFR